MVEAICYKLEGCWFEDDDVEFFSIYLIFPFALWLWSFLSPQQK
jgi:hypothetical protein